jgi:hypothetical protein
MIAIYEIANKSNTLVPLNRKDEEDLMDKIISSGSYDKVKGAGVLLGDEIGSFEDKENLLSFSLSHTKNYLRIQFIGGSESDVSGSKGRLDKILETGGFIIR